jgi:uncharacterized protein involved in type VI secretion and phage assembly
MQREPIFSPLTVPAAGWGAVPLLARVVSLDDPDRRNRVQIALLSLTDSAAQDARLWARVVAPMAGDDRGLFCLPEVGDEVLVVFVQGDLRAPLIIGGLWNGASPSPADIESGGENRTKRLRTKNGITITLDDQSGTETLILETPAARR